MTIPLVARQEPFECIDQILVTARTRFDDRDARGGVGDENVAQAVTVRCAERPHIAGEIDDAPPRGVDVEHGGVHDPKGTDAAFLQPIARLAGLEERN
jgi:hypothetical protein